MASELLALDLDVGPGRQLLRAISAGPVLAKSVLNIA
jgi:hypothetical protein